MISAPVCAPALRTSRRQRAPVVPPPLPVGGVPNPEEEPPVEPPVAADAPPAALPADFARPETARLKVGLDFLQQGGLFCEVSFHGLSRLLEGLPEEVNEEVRDWLTKRHLYILPTADLRKLRSLAERFRSLPTRFGYVVLGLAGNSKARWIPNADLPRFVEAFNALVVDLHAIEEDLDARRPELYERWERVVHAVARNYRLGEGAEDHLCGLFPRTFAGLVRPKPRGVAISNPIALEQLAAQQSQAEAERLQAQAGLATQQAQAEAERLQAQAQVEAVTVAAQERVAQAREAERLSAEAGRLRAQAEVKAAELALQERLAQAREVARQSTAAVSGLLAQIEHRIYHAVDDALSGLNEGGRSIGPALRNLRELRGKVRLLTELDSEGALDEALAALEATAQQYPVRGEQGEKDAALAHIKDQADRIARATRQGAQQWKVMAEGLDETVRVVRRGRGGQ